MWLSGQVPFRFDQFAVPITLQSMLALTIPVVFVGRNASGGILLWLVLGLLDVRVFANQSGGLGVLYSNSGGYLIGFYIIGYFSRAMKPLMTKFNLLHFVLYFIAGQLILTVIGLSWIYVGGYSQIQWTTHFLPFLPGLFIKSILGALLLLLNRRFNWAILFKRPMA